MTTRPAQRRNADRGFTLVELSVVVTIVGVLAVLAVVGYRRLITSSHLTEATGMVNAIRVAQESYHAETGTYASPSSGATPWPSPAGAYPGGGDLCPSSSTLPGAFKTGWWPACGNGTKWSSIPVHVDGPVFYGYWSVGGTGSTISTGALPTTAVNGTQITSVATPSGEWYVVAAVGDPDGDHVFSAVLGMSATNDLFVQGDGN